jgi:hypothetical protein
MTRSVFVTISPDTKEIPTVIRSFMITRVVVEVEFQEKAAECLAAKEALLAAETDEQFQLAKRKMDIFCND